MPHRSPGTPDTPAARHLQGRPIRYYRPRGDAGVRALIEEGFQAFNAGRLSEACHVFTDRMLDPAHDTTIGLTMAGALTPAGLGGCVHRAARPRSRRLRHQHRRQPLPRSALRAELHPAPRVALRSTTSSCTRTASSASTTCCSRPPCCSRPTPTSGSSSARCGAGRAHLSSAELHYRLGRDLLDRRAECEEYSVVAKAAAAGVPIYTSSPGDSSIGMNVAYHRLIERSGLVLDPSRGRQRRVRHHPGRREERLRDTGRRIAEELLPARASRRCGRCTASRKAATTTSSRSPPIRWSGAGSRAPPRPRR